MIEVGKKDKVFVAVALPLALLGCFVHFVRQPLVRERAALTAERAGLPDPDMFPAQRRTLLGRVADAERALAAARAEKPPAVRVKGDPAETEAARQQTVVDILRAQGVRVVEMTPVDAAGAPADALRAAGARPEPAARRLVLEADYPALVDALKEFETRRLAVVPGAFALETDGATCRWEVTLWL